MGWILFYLFLLCKQSLGTKSDTVLCPVSEYTDDQEKTVKEFFECPRAEDPDEYNLCCNDQCCPSYYLDSILQVDQHIAMIISLSVIIICVVSGLTIIICCFVSSCPMYESCTSSGGWTSQGDLNSTQSYPWSNDYDELEPAIIMPNGNAVSGSGKTHHLAGQLNTKDLQAAENV